MPEPQQQRQQGLGWRFGGPTVSKPLAPASSSAAEGAEKGLASQRQGGGVGDSILKGVRRT